MRIMTFLLALTMAAAWCDAKQPGRQGGRGRGAAAAAPVKTELQKILETAVDDERLAKAYYSAVIKKFGEVRPFTNIVQAEGRHEQALLGLLEKYNYAAPKDRYDVATMEVPGTLAEATAKAIEHEKKNVAMYDGFLKTVTQEDVKLVLEHLRMASADHHLPALEGKRGGGRGQGRGQGQCQADCPACKGAGQGKGQGQGQGGGYRGGRGAQPAK